jgi:dihydroflavonol-4-reductase
MSKKYMYFSSEKAKEKLSYTSRPAVDAIADACVWFKENGYC